LSHLTNRQQCFYKQYLIIRFALRDKSIKENYMSILSLIKRAPKRFSAVVAMIAVAIIVPASLHAWGPNRTLYTMEAPAGHVTFNSITDNPVQGYEPNFMQVKNASASNSTYADSIKVQPGQEYTIFVYYHNDASSTLNASGVGIAHGAYVRAAIPAVVNGTANSDAFVGATNATPAEVFDDITLTSDSSVNLTMVPGSAHIYSNGAINGASLSDNIVTTGVPLGYDALDGVVPGCNQYAGYVTFNVKASVPQFTVQKQVRLAGTSTWSENVTANPGDTLNYRIEYDNTGETTQSNVVVKDVLPAHVSYIPGSTTIKNGANPNGKAINDDLTTIGVNIGSYGPNGNAFLYFNAKVASVDELACGTQTLTNTAKATYGSDTEQDTATVTVNRTCTTQINVCNLSTKTVVTIDESQFDSTKYSKDLSVCTTTPPQLPHTGPTENIVAFLGVGALVASVIYYIRSRRALV
jgi:uncharacterized repeat protein (TIGR01451 family)